MSKNPDTKETALYKDAAQPLERRLEDLLARMTLDEKIAQLGSYWVYELLENFTFSLSKTEKLLKNGCCPLAALMNMIWMRKQLFKLTQRVKKLYGSTI